MLDPQVKKCLLGISYKSHQAIQKEEFTLEDFGDILVLLGGLIRQPSFSKPFLKWLGQMAELPEVKETAKRYGGSTAEWGLRMFSRFVKSWK